MTRVKGGTVARNRRRKVLKQAKGYFGSKHRLFKTAKEQLMHSGVYAFRDRKQKKRNFRKLWITRINAACRLNEISYSKFMDGINKAGLEINRKMLSEIAIDSADAFKDLVVIAKNSLQGVEYKPAAVKIEKAEAKVSTKKETEDVKKPTVKKATKVEAKKAAPKKVVTEKKPAVKKATTTKKN